MGDLGFTVPVGEEGKQKLLEIESRIRKLENDLNSQFREMFTEKNRSIENINKLGFLSKTLHVNGQLLQAFANVYDCEEPLVFTSLARGIFELHLTTIEAMSTTPKFLEFVGRIFDASESYIQRFCDEAYFRNDTSAIQELQNELVRISRLRKKYDRVLGPISQPKHKSRYEPNYKELAVRHGMESNYEFYYRILSSFIHPSLLYVATTPPIPNPTLSNKNAELVNFNYQGKRAIAKSMAVQVAFEASQSTEKFILVYTKNLLSNKEK